MAHRILIVDDEPLITLALRLRLEQAGHTVHQAINGLAGVEAAAREQPDVIVLDIRMPDIDGFEAFERIRELPGGASIPVIFLSANVQDEARRRARTLGAAAFLAKPYVAADVIAAVNDALSAPASATSEPTHA